MKLNGNLNGIHCFNVLQMINREGLSGVLHISDLDSGLSIYMENGEVVYADGLDIENRILSFLQSRGRLSDADLENIEAIGRSKPYALGAHLLKNNFMSVQDWEGFLQRNVEQVLFSAFLAPEGEFTFSTTSQALPPEYKIRTHLMKLILETSRKIDEWSVVRGHIPNGDIVFQKCEDVWAESEGLKFNEEELAVASLIDAKRTVNNITSDCGFDEYTVAKILHSFLSSGLINRVEENYVDWNGSLVSYEDIIALYIKCFRILEKNVETSIGGEFYRIYQLSLAAHGRKGNTVLAGFNPFAESRMQDVKLITERLARFVSFSDGKKKLLQGLNDLLKCAVDELKLRVEPKLVERSINDILTLVSSLGRYHRQEAEINLLALHMQNSFLSNGR